MLAVNAELPADDERWSFEFKWDGVRALASCDGAGVRLVSRRGNEVTAAYPELAPLASAAGCDVLLDGEVVALDERGRPSFHRLQHRMHVRDPHGARQRAAAAPVVFLAFDVLHLRGRSTRALPYEQRRELLEGLGLASERWQVPPARRGDGELILEAAEELGLEGVVAKRLGSVYEPGRRSRNWRKVKLITREEFVVGGWLSGEGSRGGRIGALLLGQYDHSSGAPRLRYAGSVGTGFSERELDILEGLLTPLRRPTSPFEEGVPRAGATWVEPVLVVEVGFGDRTPAGVIRHPRYAGRRADKDARDVVRELGA